MHYFQFNIGDYASHTRHLSLMEDLAYRRLLDLYYLRDGKLYGDEKEVARQIGLRDHVDEVAQVLQDFFVIAEDDRWAHDRCDAELAEYRNFLEKQRENGKRGGRPKNNPEKPTANPSLTQDEPKKSLTTNHKPLTNNQDKSPKGDMSSGDDLTVNDVIEAWNDLAVDRGLPKVSKVTEARRRQVQARIKEYPDAGDWSKALSAIDKSKFLCGDNDRGWRANFDFLLQPSTFIKLLEGTYDR
jgi:uncharacterized protein YdaU (DUF1376 family)